MEDNLTRAITIGVTVFLLIIVITAISMYYNTAVEQAAAFKNRVDYGTVDTKDIDELQGAVITGMEARNIIRRFATKYNDISILTYQMIDEDGDGEKEKKEIYTSGGTIKDEIDNIKEDVLINAADLSTTYKVRFEETSNTLNIELEVI